MILALLFLSFLVPSASALTTSNDELTTIMKDVRDEWWRGGWDKRAELAAFIEKHESDKTACATAQFYIGANDYADKNYEQAVTAFGKVISQYPGAAECAQAQYEMGYAYEHLKWWDDAIWAYNETAANYGACEWVAKALFRLGQCHQRKKDYAPAIETFARLLAEYPASPEAPQALIKTGYCHRMLKQPEQELAAYERVLAEHGSSKQAADAKMKIAEYYKRHGDVDQAEREFANLAATHPDQAEAPVALMKQAKAQMEQGQPVAAMATYASVERDYPKSNQAPKSCLAVADHYWRQGELDCASECYERLLATYPNERLEVLNAHLRLGDIARQSGDDTDALAHYRGAYETPYHRDVNLLERTIENIYRILANRSQEQADQFIRYNFYGASGKDGISGTADDLTNSLYSATSQGTALKVMLDRLAYLGTRNHSTLQIYLQARIGDAESAATSNAEYLVPYTEKLSDPGATKGDRVAALRQYFEGVQRQFIPFDKLRTRDLFRAEIERRQQSYSDVIAQARSLAVEYAGDAQEKHIKSLLAEAMHLLANAHSLVCEYDNAIEIYQEILNIGAPEEWAPFCKFNVGNLYMRKTDNVNGLAWYRKIIYEHPHHLSWPARTHIQMAYYFHEQGKHEQAIDELTKLLDHYPSDQRQLKFPPDDN